MFSKALKIYHSIPRLLPILFLNRLFLFHCSFSLCASWLLLFWHSLALQRIELTNIRICYLTFGQTETPFIHIPCSWYVGPIRGCYAYKNSYIVVFINFVCNLNKFVRCWNANCRFVHTSKWIVCSIAKRFYSIQNTMHALIPTHLLLFYATTFPMISDILRLNRNECEYFQSISSSSDSLSLAKL